MNPELTPSVVAEPVITPSEEPKTEVVIEDVPVTSEPVLYELPDGRKVDAATLQVEWKEKFMPEFTQKSQRLAEITKAADPNINNLPEWKREGYVPKSYAEIIEIAKGQALEDLARGAEADEKARAQVAAQVDSTIAALKAKDPKMDENALFAHANKYGFRDLNAAHENMAEMKRIALTTEERVLKGKTKVDPISTGKGGAGATPINYGQRQNFGSAADFLARVKGQK